MKPIPNLPTDLRIIGWSADGKGVLGYRREANPTPVFWIEPATGAQRKLFEIAHAPFEDVSNVRLSADLKSCAYTTNSLLHDLYLMRGLR